MSDVEQASATEEHRFHAYRGNTIPWYVRFIWLLFWAFTIYYIARYFLPAIQTELVSPP